MNEPKKISSSVIPVTFTKMKLLTGIFVLGVLIGYLGVSDAQLGAKCSDRIATLYPRQNLDLGRMVGEWMGIEMAWRDGKQVTPQWARCPSQVFSKQDNSVNLNIILKYDLVKTNQHTERVGQIDISPGQHSHWRKWFFEDPSRWWEEVVVATDYDNFWIQYECEVDKEGVRVETVVMRSRRRSITRMEKEIYESLVEGLGFPAANFVVVPQPPICGRGNATVGGGGGGSPKAPPVWFTLD